MKLKTETAPGPNRILARFLKEHADVLALALAKLFNQSLREEVWYLRTMLPRFIKKVAKVIQKIIGLYL